MSVYSSYKVSNSDVMIYLFPPGLFMCATQAQIRSRTGLLGLSFLLTCHLTAAYTQCRDDWFIHES